MLRVISLPYCRVVMAAPWNEPPARRFAAYRCRGDFRRLLGHAVIDEFATLSSPVFLGPEALAGKLYDAGISLGHRRDPGMDLDTGWPPLVVGLQRLAPAPELPEQWQDELLDAIAATPAGGEPLAGADSLARRQAGPWQLERIAIGEALVLATDAPLLPKQLGRLCEVSTRPFVLALAVSALGRPAEGAAHELEAVSEERLGELLAVAESLGQ